MASWVSLRISFLGSFEVVAVEERDLLGFMGGWGFLKVETLWETQLSREVGDLGFRIRDIVFTSVPSSSSSLVSMDEV